MRECYDPCDTDNIYLNMSTKEFLENIEKYLIEIFNMENSVVIGKYNTILKAILKVEIARNLYNEVKIAIEKYKGKGEKAALKAKDAENSAKYYFDLIEADPNTFQTYYSTLENKLEEAERAAKEADVAKEAEAAADAAP